MGKMDTLTFASSPMDTPCGLFFYLVNLVCIHCANLLDYKVLFKFYSVCILALHTHVLGQAMCKPFLNSCMLRDFS